MYDKREIFEKYLAGTCTPEQAAWLVALFADESFREELEMYMDAAMDDQLEEEDIIEELYTQSKNPIPNLRIAAHWRSD
jgi:hypothetical protein